ncbi:tetratricopeptide repeat protein [Jiulongibacter sp. NS-SX5]|uniref:tetratricopeptide repeat protein n=1 Tax=Jiulongibacter sp. NS-SX5 TaxID=3463854 RepID=UPI0040590A43
MKKYFILFFSILLCGGVSRAQDSLYNESNTRKFAEYLLESGQYSFAVKEFERLNYLNPEDLDAKLNLMKAYRLSGGLEDGIRRSQLLFEDIRYIPQKHAVEYSKLLLSNRNWETAQSYWLSTHSLSEKDKALLNTTVEIFNSDFVEAQKYVNLVNDSTDYLAEGYRSIIDRGLNGKRKSPFLAGMMSTAVPGLGKAYTGDWKDGIVSLIFTGGMAFQAYRKFNQFGVNNYRPWVYTVIGSGFYLGNIYGSVKSAKNKNRKRINLLQHEASDLFNAYY